MHLPVSKKEEIGFTKGEVFESRILLGVIAIYLKVIMAKQIKTITDITPTTKQPWTAKIMVLEKGFPKDSMSSPRKFQRLILADSQGTQVQATIFGQDIELLRNTLVVLKKYYISNAVVRRTEPRYRVVPHQYQWIINAKVIIEEATSTNDEISHLNIPYKFVSFSSFPTYKDTSSLIDILGIVFDLLPPKELRTKNGIAKVQELIMINDELQPIIVTTWNQFVENEISELSQIIDTKPVVACLRLKVVSFNDLSLSTRSTSGFVLNPKIPQAAQLKIWYSKNISDVEKTISSKNFYAYAESSNNPIQRDLINISSLADFPDNKLFWAKCFMEVEDLHQKFWYMACSNCHKATSATFMQVFNCYYCRQRDVHGFPRARVNIRISDSTGTIHGTMFGVIAEKMLSCPATTLMDITLKEEPDKLLSSIRTHIDRELMLQAKAYNVDFYGQSVKRLHVLSVEFEVVTDKRFEIDMKSEQETENIHKGKEIVEAEGNSQSK